jgi:hypothetical protein
MGHRRRERREYPFRMDIGGMIGYEKRTCNRVRDPQPVFSPNAFFRFLSTGVIFLYSTISLSHARYVVRKGLVPVKASLTYRCLFRSMPA